MATAKMTSEKTANVIAGVLRSRQLWAAAAIVFALVLVHYSEIFARAWGLSPVSSILGLGLTRHTFERILFLVPVAYVSATLGLGGGLSVLALVTAAMLPRVFLLSPEPREALFETGGVVSTGLLIVLLSDALQKGRQRLADLETAHDQLNLQIKRLGMLHAVSAAVSQSLEPAHVLNVIDRVGGLPGVEAAWLYLWDKDGARLKLAKCSGESGAGLPRELKPGEALDGAVVRSREPVVAEDSGGLPPNGNFKSALSVPLLFKGELVGTLGVGSRDARYFPPDEVDLLRAIADQVSMAMENARLYEGERQAARALRASEANYRELFENASDAIWVHDLSGRILAVNGAFERLAGYSRDKLVGSDASLLLASHGLGKADGDAHDLVLRGGVAASYEEELTRKDGSKVIVESGTALITREDSPWAFQHIARDVTEEKRVRENLKFYVQQVSQAQEAERKRIARELHDETAQSLVTVIRNLDDLASGKSQVSARDIQEQVREALRGVRQFSQQLRPSILDDLGLLPALKWLASELTGDHGIVAEVRVSGEERHLQPAAELMLFRIAQEALNNARRHAGASSVAITMEFAGSRATMTVSDNGKGFELPARVGDLAREGKLGLAGMQERAQLLGGTFNIVTAPGKGTSVTVQVPYKEPARVGGEP